jgi:hypothetical protein
MAPKHRGGLKDPRQARKGEQIGGGYFVFRDGTGRIRPAMWPFEHPTLESAIDEAKRLAGLQLGHEFVVFAAVAGFSACRIIDGEVINDGGAAAETDKEISQ